VLRYHGGAFPATWAEFGAMTPFACYDLKNVKSESIRVIVNRPKDGGLPRPVGSHGGLRR
jgi:hypothetical protein